MEIMSKTDWNLRFMRIADLEIAQWSKDRSSKVGCVIVKNREIVTSGYNGIPRGVNDDVEERHARPEKYHWFIHSEANAIINAARQGKSTLDCDMYVNWFPCDSCSGFIVQAGIKRLFCDKEPDLNNPNFGEGYMNYDAHRQ